MVENVRAHGTGGLNIDASRVGVADADYARNASGDRGHDGTRTGDEQGATNLQPGGGSASAIGRWPPNALFVHTPGCRKIGTREVRTGVAGPNSGGFGGGMFGGSVGPDNIGGTHAVDGKETIAAYACEPGCPVADLDRQSGPAGAAAAAASGPTLTGETPVGRAFGARNGTDRPAPFHNDKGGASRFFPNFTVDEDDIHPEDTFPFRYQAKAARSEREYGTEGLAPRAGHDAVDREVGSDGLNSPRAGAGRTTKAVRNFHPTVKPVALARWLVRLLVPPGGTVLDPFLGSGTTGIAAVREGFGFVGIEKDTEEGYVDIAVSRIRKAEADLDARASAASTGTPDIAVSRIRKAEADLDAPPKGVR
jgi:hypothetical protein